MEPSRKLKKKKQEIYYTNTNEGLVTVQKDDMDKASLSLHPKETF